MSSKDVLAARLLTTFLHEMRISAGAAPFAFNALGIGSRANNGVIAALGGGIGDHPHIGGNVSGLAATCLMGTLLSFPGIKHLTAHEPWAFLGADDNAMLQHVKHSNAKGILGFLAHTEMLGRGNCCHGSQESVALSGVVEW